MDMTGTGRQLHADFVSLGDLTGKTIEDVIAVLGRPQSKSLIGTNILLQWIEPGCHISLRFDHEGKFVVVQHVFANYAPERNPVWSVLGIVIAVILGLVMFLAR